MQGPVCNERMSQQLVFADGLASPTVPFDNADMMKTGQSRSHGKATCASKQFEAIHEFTNPGQTMAFIRKTRIQNSDAGKVADFKLFENLERNKFPFRSLNSLLLQFKSKGHPMPPFQLTGFAESGNTFKVAMMLQACGLEWSQVNVDFFNGETRGAAFREGVNEMGEVPVLVHGGKRLTQSGTILTYLAQQSGQFGGGTEDEKLEILSWLLFDNHKFTSYLATLRFLVALAKTGETPVTEFLRGRAVAALGIVENHFNGRSFMVGSQASIADISMCGYLFHPEEYGIDWVAYPRIAAWKARVAQLPGWKPPYELLTRAPAKRG